jgi:putative transposase
MAYVSRLTRCDQPAIHAIRRLAGQYLRYGYRRIRIFLRREATPGVLISRIACGAKPAYRCRVAARGGEWPLADPDRSHPPDATTSRPTTFVSDTCANGQGLKCQTVVDEWTRECPAIDVADGIRSGRVNEVLAQLVSVHGAPRCLRSDDGPEFIATAILRWLADARSRRRTSTLPSRG